jgi:hypothetical protein
MADHSDNPFPTCLKISPSSFKLDVVLNKDFFLDMQLENFTNQTVAFKVKTTARDRYLLRPTQDIIPANSSKTCRIVLSAMAAYPDANNPKNLKDKFLIQSLPANEITNNNIDLTKFWKEKEAEHNPKANKFVYAEQRIKCKLNVPEKTGKEEISSSEAPNIGNNNLVAAAAVNSASSLPTAASKTNSPKLPTTTLSNKANSIPNPAEKSLNNEKSAQQSETHAAPNNPVHPAVSAVKRDSGSGSAGNSVNSSTNYDYQTDFDRLSSERKRREYDELMDFVVKLTAQMEEQKAQHSIVNDKYQKALNTINTLTKKNQQLQFQLQQFNQINEGESKDTNANNTDSTNTSNTNDAELRKRNNRTETNPAQLASHFNNSRLPASGKGFQFETYHIVLMAVLCFILGRLLS